MGLRPAHICPGFGPSQFLPGFPQIRLAAYPIYMSAGSLLAACTPAALSTASDEELAAVAAVLAAERERRAASRVGPATHKADRDDDDFGASDAVIELASLEARVAFAREHGLPYDTGVQDTIEEDLDCCGVPERYALRPPPNWTAYRRQKPGICFFPSDRDAVFVVSERVFGSVSAEG